MQTILKRIGLAVLILLVILVAVWWREDFKARAEVEKVQAELRARGYPMSIEELRPPPVPDDQNAALIMAKVSDMLSGTNTTSAAKAACQVVDAISKLPAMTDLSRWTAEQWATMPKLIFSPDLEVLDGLLQEASVRPTYNNRLKYEDGPLMDVPNFSRYRDAIRYLVVKARLQAEDGESDEALASIECAMNLCLHLQNEPTEIHQLVRFAFESLVLTAMMDMSKVTGPDEWARFRQIVLTIPDAQPFVRSLDGERLCFAGWAFERAINISMANMETVVRDYHLFIEGVMYDNLGGTKFADGVAILLGRPLLRRDYAFYLSSMAELEKAASFPYFKADIPGIQQRKQQIPRRFIVSRLLLSNLSNYFGKQTEIFAQRDVFLAGLELKRYKAEQGEYPENLAALVPGYCKVIPSDPFTGKPLRYRRAEAGFVLYSVGPDLKDNGGTPKPAKSNSTSDWDIVWISRN